MARLVVSDKIAPFSKSLKYAFQFRALKLDIFLITPSPNFVSSSMD